MWIMTLLNLIPGVANVVQTITTAWFNSKVQMYQAKTGTTRDIAIAAITAEVQNNQTKVSWITALAGNPVMMMVVVGFALPWIIYEWQAIVVDTVWNRGTTFTPEIKGLFASFGNVILTGIFVTSTGVGIFHSWMAHKD